MIKQRTRNTLGNKQIGEENIEKGGKPVEIRFFSLVIAGKNNVLYVATTRLDFFTNTSNKKSVPKFELYMYKVWTIKKPAVK